MITVDLDQSEGLRNRTMAKQLMRRLKPRADEIITRQTQGVRPPPPLAPPVIAALPNLSLDHMPIIALEEMDRQIGEATVTYVSFISGTLFGDVPRG
jgi:hypothetical protein